MITDMALVKTLARIETTNGAGVPTTAGEIGDIYLDVDSGLTYEWDGAEWVPYTEFDRIINAYLQRVESDYLRIRGIPFAEVEGETVYPDGAETVAAEMVCFLAGLGDYEGRNLKSESVGGRSATIDDKVRGYPAGIVDNIKRYVRAL